MDAAELVKVILCFGFALFCLSAVFYRFFGDPKKVAKLLDEQKKPRKAEKVVPGGANMGFWSSIFDEMLHGPLEERLSLNRQLQQKGEEIAKAGNARYVVVIESNWGYAGGYHTVQRYGRDYSDPEFLKAPPGRRFVTVGDSFYVLDGKTANRHEANILPENLAKLPPEQLTGRVEFVYSENWTSCVSAELGHWEFEEVGGRIQPVWELNEKGMEEHVYRRSRDSVTGL